VGAFTVGGNEEKNRGWVLGVKSSLAVGGWSLEFAVEDGTGKDLGREEIGEDAC